MAVQRICSQKENKGSSYGVGKARRESKQVPSCGFLLLFHYQNGFPLLMQEDYHVALSLPLIVKCLRRLLHHIFLTLLFKFKYPVRKLPGRLETELNLWTAAATSNIKYILSITYAKPRYL